ncbi:hypothetical protein [Pseudonocardia kunmingensis]|uniref:Uncharacterized protein n=1 Tax=Pseudonocardia kunmingensis TaxID=630975 RepID=A0A543D999_9PSEU|nr:hypothetical protein [Pseudonocardia kunmingensis]TQM05890.1 hypothetical protein FB558_6112 [Pseudonocardia kunmingensis]
MSASPNPAPSPQVLALATERGLGRHVSAQQLGHPVSTTRLVASAVFTALCVAWLVFAWVGDWGLLLLALGLPFFLMTGIKMFGTVALYRNQREVHLFDGGVVVVAGGRPTAFRWPTLTVTPNRLGDKLLDVRLSGDGNEAVLVAGSFGDDVLARLTRQLQDATG